MPKTSREANAISAGTGAGERRPARSRGGCPRFGAREVQTGALSPVGLPPNPALDLRTGKGNKSLARKKERDEKMVAAGRKISQCSGTREQGRACWLAGNSVNGERDRFCQRVGEGAIRELTS